MLVTCSDVTQPALVLDLSTGHVTDISEVSGEQHVSPDGRHLVTTRVNDGTISVTSIAPSGEAKKIVN